MNTDRDPGRFLRATILFLAPQIVMGSESSSPDYLSFAQGALLVEVGGSAAALKVDAESALQAIDGDYGVYSLTPRPGGPDTEIFFVYRLPAATTFTTFAVPNVLETPSPSQTFFRDIEISGSTKGAEGPFEALAATTLATHEDKNLSTEIHPITSPPVIWVKITLRGGIDVQRDKTFFEFSEIIGYGSQEPVPLLDRFGGKWKGRGVLLELKQDAATVVGCYDGSGDLSGTVTGNILRATGTSRSAGIPSTFVLTVTDGGDITGVRSTNGAPFRIYTGASAPDLTTECSAVKARPPGCGATVHGINFDYDSDAIRPESAMVLDALFAGLTAAPESAITIVGHTSSEGSDGYNLDLSQRRAQSVIAALATRGIEPTRLTAKGAGEGQPIADNTTAAGRSLNRRVEVLCR
ncbi:MAG: OmpA family protein [Gammaproteobacteria bacterium]|nr:OmpA family protein [Gammaproteobacteria bacterium]